MTQRKIFAVGIAGAGLLVALAFGASSALTFAQDDGSSGVPRPTATEYIETSYGVNVYDLTVVMGHTGEVFVVDVVGVSSVDLNNGWTTYRADIVNSVRGKKTSGEALLSQLGFVDADGVAHVAEEQPMLQPGSRYLIAGNLEDDGTVTVFAGPNSARKIGGPQQQERLVAEYRSASS